MSNNTTQPDTQPTVTDTDTGADTDTDTDWDEEDDIWDGTCVHCGNTLRTDTRQDLTGSTRCDDTNPAHTHHIPEGSDDAPVTVCETCEDYVEDPRLRPTSKGDDDEYDHGWVHIENDSSYCPGQGDDDTGDYASPRHTTIGDAFPDGLPD